MPRKNSDKIVPQPGAIRDSAASGASRRACSGGGKVSDLTKIKVGDKVVMGRSAYPDHESNRIEVVTRLTATQIVVGSDRYRLNGYRCGGSCFMDAILRVASEKDIERRAGYDAKRKAEAQEREATQEFLRKLSALFKNADVYRYNSKEDIFRVEFHGLSEAQVRDLAKVSEAVQ